MAIVKVVMHHVPILDMSPIIGSEMLFKLLVVEAFDNPSTYMPHTDPKNITSVSMINVGRIAYEANGATGSYPARFTMQVTCVDSLGRDPARVASRAAALLHGRGDLLVLFPIGSKLYVELGARSYKNEYLRKG